MVKRIKLILGFLAVFILMETESLYSEEVYLGITRSESVRISATLIRIEASEAIAGRTSEVRSIVEADLKWSGVFQVMDPPRLPNVLSLDELKEADIQAIGQDGVEAVIWIVLMVRGKDFILEGRAYDGASGNMVVGKRYAGRPGALRSMLHRFSDEIVFRYTGQRGVAETRIAYTSKLTGSKELYLMDYDGYNSRRLTSDQSLNLSPDWSPDGQWLTYTSYRDGDPDIYTMDLATGRRWKMVDYKGLDISPSWSASGDFLAFASTKGGTLQVYVMNRSGKEIRQLTHGFGDNLSPAWSPTGKEIAFVSNQGGTPQIYIVNTDGTNMHRLSFKGSYNTSPVWSPKADWIAYTCQVERRLRICLISPDGSQRIQLTHEPGEQEEPSWSPDGRHIVFRSTGDGKGGDLYRIMMDGGEAERLTFNGAQNGSPVWSPYKE